MPTLNTASFLLALALAVTAHLGGFAGLAYLILPEHPRPEMVVQVSLVPPPPPPPAAPPPPAQASKAPPVRFDKSRLVEVTELPDEKALAALESVPAGISGGVAGGVLGGIAGGSLGGVLGGILESLHSVPVIAPPPAPLPEEAPPAVPRQLRVPGAVQKALLVKQVRPDYPRLAKEARIEGTVRIEILVDVEGKVEDLRLIEGHPLLAQAALQAVKQWEFRPTRLRGTPIATLSVVDVVFRLRQGSAETDGP